jgi:hypothetical protein
MRHGPSLFGNATVAWLYRERETPEPPLLKASLNIAKDCSTRPSLSRSWAFPICSAYGSCSIGASFSAAAASGTSAPVALVEAVVVGAVTACFGCST